jgi:ribonuclease T2
MAGPHATILGFVEASRHGCPQGWEADWEFPIETRQPTSRLALLLPLPLLVMGMLFAASGQHRQRQHGPGQPGVFDYYVLSLSWSPEFCHSHPSDLECSGHRGFVVHGLWPQYVEGYPENCSSQPGPSNPETFADIMPNPSLVAHEWASHGTCSGLDPNAYFKLVRQAFESVKMPERLSAPPPMFSTTPQQLKEEFVSANRGLSDEDLAVGCGNNYLTSVSVCFTKQLQPRACQGIRDCRANSIRVAPVR